MSKHLSRRSQDSFTGIPNICSASPHSGVPVDYIRKSEGDILLFRFLARRMDKSKISVMSREKKKITLTVNGRERTITADPESSLLDAIRDDMREASVQLRCGEGRCGGCVVLLDGQRVLSCDIPLSQADKRSVTII